MKIRGKGPKLGRKQTSIMQAHRGV